MTTAFVVGPDVYGIDLDLWDTGVLSSYVVVDDEPTLIDTGTAKSVDRLRAGLAEVGLAVEDLEHAILSHVHLDHAGGAHQLVAEAPHLDVHIHDRTAGHLVDPAGLVASTEEAMGPYFEAIGAPSPIPADRIRPVPDEGATVSIGDRSLELLHVPGHSPDHLAVWSPRDDVVFANESMVSHFPKADLWLPPATVPRFDPERVRESIDTLAALEPSTVALAHFGAPDVDSAALAETARERLDTLADEIRRRYEQEGSLSATVDRVAADLLPLSGYDDRVAGFYARMVTRGYLRALGLAS